MSLRNIILPLIAFVGLSFFFAFLVEVLMLRYERGDVYPPYSTLRADPLGARAYYEAVGTLKGYSTERGFDVLHDELAEKPGTIFYLGFDDREMNSFSRDEVKELDAFVRDGGRVVLTFTPEKSYQRKIEDDLDKEEEKERKAKEQRDKEQKTAKDKKDKGTPAEDEKDKPAPAPEEKEDKSDASNGPQTEQEKYEREEMKSEKEFSEKLGHSDPYGFHYHRTLTALWGFDVENVHDLPKDATKKEPVKKEEVSETDSESDSEKDEEKKPEVMALHSTSDGLEGTVTWKSAGYFVRLAPEWQVLYKAKDKPVLLRRPWGRGEIIVASDSYFLSNEALRNERSTALLGLLAGSGGGLLFDETHLGTQRQEGVMFLMNKLKLEGYLYGMLAVMALFLWRNSMPLVPPRAVTKSGGLGGVVSGKDSRSGLVNLLRRNIGAAEILPASFAEWKRTVTPSQTHLQERLTAMDQALTSADLKRPEKIVETYHQLRQINTGLTTETYATKS